MQRVVAAHDALQFGELADHVGQQVGLGQQGGLFGLQRQAFAAQLLADRLGDGADALRRVRPGCPACCDRRPWPGRGRVIPASSCDPGRRRTWRRPGVGGRRARCRRSPRPGSAGLILLTTRNLLVSLPAASSSGKYFWLAFMVRIRHSCGTARNSSSNWPISTFGRSTSAVTSSSSASSSIGVSTGLGAQLQSWRAISARRSAKVAMTAPSRRQRGGVIVGIGKDDRIDGGFEAVTLRFAARVQAEDGDRDDIGAVQRHKAVRRTDEIDAAPAVLQLVAHHLGDRQSGERRFKSLLQALGQCRTLGQAVVEQHLGLAVAFAAQTGATEASAPSAASFLSSAGVALPVASRPTATGISLCSTGLSAATSATSVTWAARRRGEA